MMDASYFTNLIANAPLQSTSRYFEQGIYHVQIDNCKFFTNRQRRPRAAVDCTVINSNNVNFPQTTQMSWVVSLDSDSGPSTLKAFIAGVMGCNEAEISNEAIGKVFIYADDPNSASQRSVAVGLQAVVNAYEKPTKNGGVFTKLSWKGIIEKRGDVAPDFSLLPKVGMKEEPVVAQTETGTQTQTQTQTQGFQSPVQNQGFQNQTVPHGQTIQSSPTVQATAGQIPF